MQQTTVVTSGVKAAAQLEQLIGNNFEVTKKRNLDFRAILKPYHTLIKQEFDNKKTSKEIFRVLKAQYRYDSALKVVTLRNLSDFIREQNFRPLLPSAKREVFQANLSNIKQWIKEGLTYKEIAQTLDLTSQHFSQFMKEFKVDQTVLSGYRLSSVTSRRLHRHQNHIKHLLEEKTPFSVLLNKVKALSNDTARVTKEALLAYIQSNKTLAMHYTELIGTMKPWHGVSEVIAQAKEQITLENLVNWASRGWDLYLISDHLGMSITTCRRLIKRKLNCTFKEIRKELTKSNGHQPRQP
jgi:AraC-like DNA-binding protein